MKNNQSQNKRKKRKYAPYFDWHDKKRKELGVLEESINTMKIRNKDYYHFPQINNHDPPDCTLLNSEGRLVAVEISELVSEDSVRKTEQGNFELKEWKSSDVVDEINSILTEKDNKTYLGGPYQKHIVVIHTDEYFINYGEYSKRLRKVHFSGLKRIDEVYLLFSFDPYEENCPYVKLKTFRRCYLFTMIHKLA